MNCSSIILLSGGIDSTTVLHHLMVNRLLDMDQCTALIFDYGQTLAKEVDIAVDNAARYGAIPKVIQLDLSWMDPDCSILEANDKQIDIGRDISKIAAMGTPSSYVVFRNGIFLAYAVGYGEAHDIPRIYMGANGLNSGNYWDDRLEFVSAMEKAANEGTSPEFNVSIMAPYSHIPKWRIVEYGRLMGVDYDRTWSCYLNGDEHCGECDSCQQREEALWRGGWRDGERHVATDQELKRNRTHS